MSNLIYKHKIIDKIEQRINYLRNNDFFSDRACEVELENIRIYIKNMQPDIISCKYCKNHSCEDNYWYCNEWKRETKEYWFCSRGGEKE